MKCRPSLLALATVAIAVKLTSPSRVDAGEWKQAFDRLPAEFTIDNPGPAVAPTIYLVGLPDRSVDPVCKSHGLTWNGVRLAEELLSESVLILRPNGTGNWGYHTGFDIFREPQFENGRRIDPRTLVEYDKWRFDPLNRVMRVGGDMNLMRLFHVEPTPAVYRVAFPSTIRIRKFRVWSNCDALGRDPVKVRVRLFSDIERKMLIAEKVVGHGEPVPQFPIEFAGLDHDRVFLELSAEAPRGTPVDLYYTLFEADLDTSQIELPLLNTGENRFQLSDDADSSHQVRVQVSWEDRPARDRLWDDFEGELQWSGCEAIAGSRVVGLPFTGREFARATFPANGQEFGLNRNLPNLDLTKHNRVGIATRAIRTAPMRAILLGIKNHDTHYQYVRPNPGNDWSFQSFDISEFRRDRVVALNIYWVAQPGFSRPDEPCIYDVDSLCFWHEDKPAAQASLPKHVASYVSPNKPAIPGSPSRKKPPIQEWFPMGVYDGVCGRTDQECVWLFDQMKRLNMNAVYVSNGTLDGLERVLPLAEARGIRLIYQGGGEASLYAEKLSTAEARRQSLVGVTLPAAEKTIPRFADRRGLAAWSLTEEIDAVMSRELKEYYALVRRLTPDQPPTVLHNSLDAAIADLETNRPLVVTHDFYPYFWSPQSGPSNPGRSVPYYRGRVSSYYRACRQHGASLWMMPQAWGTIESASLDAPNYGYRSGMRTPEPGEIMLQGWVAVAEGATGIMFYATLAGDDQERQLWDAGWTETDNTRAAGELFKQISRVAPLLSRLERDYRETDFVQSSTTSVLAHRFVKRPGYGEGKARYVVVASLDGFQPQKVDLTIHHGTHRVYDMVMRRDITDELRAMKLPPGEGKVLLIGTQVDFEADCRLIDAER